MNILLTNDDGIDAVGIRTLYDRLSAVADVTAVAPVDDQSAVGRQLSRTVDLYDHEMGYAVEGTPSDCVIAALGSLDFDPDLVVSGINQGRTSEPTSSDARGPSRPPSKPLSSTFRR